MVKGTTKRSGAQLAEEIAAMGGKISAAGDIDYSEIKCSALARFWRPLLELTAELALTARSSPPEEVAGERDWLLSRVQRRRDNAPSRAFDELYAALYGPHPVRDSRARHARSRCARHRPRRARRALPRVLPSRADGALGERPGDGATRCIAEARRLFGGDAAGGGAADPALPAPAPAGRRIVIEQPAQQTQIVVGAIAPSLDHADHAAVKVLSTVLGGGMAGRLFVELRDRRGLAYTATSFYEPVKEPGALILYLGYRARERRESGRGAARRRSSGSARSASATTSSAARRTTCSAAPRWIGGPTSGRRGISASTRCRGSGSTIPARYPEGRRGGDGRRRAARRPDLPRDASRRSSSQPPRARR